jgi:DNA polymerase I-like protein with 3'-5' exonuclease and polymerase domains
MSDIRRFFQSRWGKDGFIIEADFSQLEVVYLAHITKDPALIADIIAGVDTHTVRAAELFSIKESDVTPQQRRIAKSFAFALQYGSGPTTMAKNTGTSVELAKKFISNYYSRYSKVKEWQESMLKRVETNAVGVLEKSPLGYPIKRSKIQSETGRIYSFKEGDAPEWMRERGKYTGFKPTEIKNYPIQGGATGDIVPMVLGAIHRWLVNNSYTGKAKLIATVHDSIVLDIHKDMLYTICSGLRKIMEGAPQLYRESFGVSFDLPLKIEIKYGPNWADMKTYEV